MDSSQSMLSPGQALLHCAQRRCHVVPPAASLGILKNTSIVASIWSLPPVQPLQQVFRLRLWSCHPWALKLSEPQASLTYKVRSEDFRSGRDCQGKLVQLAHFDRWQHGGPGMLSQVKGGTCWKTYKFWVLETGFIRVLLSKAATDFGEQRQGRWLLIKLNPNLRQWREGGHVKFPPCGAYRSASSPLFPAGPRADQQF